LECGVYSTVHDYGRRLSAEGGTGRMADGGPPKARFGKRDQERLGDGLETPFPSMNGTMAGGNLNPTSNQSTFSSVFPSKPRYQMVRSSRI
jgi:hypothetical protein